MKADELRAVQAPFKTQYRNDPAAAMITLSASGSTDDGLVCKVDTATGAVAAGLHPATGGDGLSVCSGDMLLESLVACAGVTLRAVATAIGIELRGARVSAEGDLDFRGTLGVDKTAPVGFQALRLHFQIDSDADEAQLQSLLKLTKRYCVVYQSLLNPPVVASTLTRGETVLQ